jgi:hypothetical protein
MKNERSRPARTGPANINTTKRSLQDSNAFIYSRLTPEAVRAEAQRIEAALQQKRDLLRALGLEGLEHRNTWSHERVDRLIARRRRSAKGAA